MNRAKKIFYLVGIATVCFGIFLSGFIYGRWGFSVAVLPERLEINKDNMLILLNEERLNAGVPMVGISRLLENPAQERAVQLFESQSCTHDDFLRKKQETKIQFQVFENLVCNADNALYAMEGLMASPTHKAALLNPAANNVGIGVKDKVVVYWIGVWINPLTTNK